MGIRPWPLAGFKFPDPLAPAPSFGGFSRPRRYLDRAGPRHRRRTDHPVAMRLIARAEVAEENNALTHHRDDQGYDYGNNWAVLLHVVILPSCCSRSAAAEFDYLPAFTMLRWSGGGSAWIAPPRPG